MLAKSSGNGGDFSTSLRSVEGRDGKRQPMNGPGNQPSPPANILIPLGEISEQSPTVSHMLKSHPDFARDCWRIIYSSANSDKDFSKMQAGTKVFYNPDTDQLSWGDDAQTMLAQKTVEPPPAVEAPERRQAPGLDLPTPEMLGVISEQTPTVSHLFNENDHFEGNYWNIINAPVNAQKNYRSLRPGTEVWLEPANNEINFSRPSLADIQVLPAGRSILAESYAPAPSIMAPPAGDMEAPAPGSTDFHESLADAVKPFIGTPYDQIDCYGLLVRGITNQGINYQGSGGVRERLESAAIRQGLPANTYLTGEGLVGQAGTTLYSRSIDPINNARQQSEEIFTEMLPNLKKGHILSFSTPTRGHTGVVSKKEDQWTYINSGLIDHQVPKGRVSRRVGEESLQAEIKNWCKLAASRNEALTVTMGRLEETKLRGMTAQQTKDLTASLQL